MSRPAWMSCPTDSRIVVPFSLSVDHWKQVEFRISVARDGPVFNDIGIMNSRCDGFHQDGLSDHVKNA